MKGSKEVLFGFCLSAAVWLGGENSVFQTHYSTGLVGHVSMHPYPESFKTTFASPESAIYVDQTTGSDSNPGTQSRPLKTIGKAAQVAQDNYRKAVSTRIIIEPGTYRESISLSGEGASGTASITFEAGKPRTASLSGSDLWTSWQPDSTDPGRYTHAWSSQWGACAAPQGSPPLEEIVRRREMVFVNGSLLAQALSLNGMTEGSFFVDEPGGRIYVRPPASIDMTNAAVEVSSRARLLDVHRVSNLTLRGLLFVQANPCVSMKPAASVNISGGSNHLIEGCSFQWNNWGGLRLDGVSDSTVRDVVASHNGAIGLAGYQLKNVSYEDVEVSYNNWRGALGNVYGWDVAGAKFLRVHGASFKRFKAVANQTRGLWFDTDNSNVTVQDSYLSTNQVNGIFLEASQGPITIKDTRVCKNGAQGVLTNNAEGVSLVADLIYGNKTAQIFINGGNKSRNDHDWETREPYTAVAHNWSLMRNTIVGTEPTQLLFEMYESSNTSSSLFLSTLASDSNTWYNPENKKVFQIDPGGPNHSPRNLDFEQWRANTKQDRNSSFAAPSADPAAACLHS